MQITQGVFQSPGTPMHPGPIPSPSLSSSRASVQLNLPGVSRAGDVEINFRAKLFQ